LARPQATAALPIEFGFAGKRMAGDLEGNEAQLISIYLRI
jgi:hypothetical protein